MNRLKQLFLRRRLYDDLDEEIALHLEERTAELVAGGMPAKEATAPADQRRCDGTHPIQVCHGVPSGRIKTS